MTTENKPSLRCNSLSMLGCKVGGTQLLRTAPAQRKAFKDSRTVFYCSFFNHLTLSSFHPELEDMISDQIMTEKIS